MRKTRKWTAVLLCAAMVSASICGCGSAAPSEEEKKVVAAASETAEAETAGSAEEASTPETASSVSAAEEQAAEEEVAAASEETVEEPAEEAADVTIEEQTLLDQDGVVVTAKEYIKDPIWGDGIKVLVENNSAQDIGISASSLIVNNYMVTESFAAEVAAGKKSNETIYIMSSDLEKADIENVGQIEIYFHVYDSASYDTVFDSDRAVIQTSKFDEMDCEPVDDGMELYNDGSIRIVGKTVDEDNFWGTAILLYAENNTDRNIGISSADLSVNGFMLSGSGYYADIYSGKMSVNELTLYESELEENDIETVEDVELKFHIYDLNTYDTIADSEPVTFAVK